MRATRDDSYRPTAKLADPMACPRCHASYLRGRWTWRPAPAGAPERTCPACLRIEQQQPAGFVTLAGPFFAAHREEILRVVGAHEQAARAAHPMQRIIGVQEVEGGVLVTTTDAHLAHALGIAMQAAYKGDLDLDFGPGKNCARVAWNRS